MIGPAEFLKPMANLCRYVYRQNLFHNTKSILEVLRTLYASKRLPRVVKEFLDRW